MSRNLELLRLLSSRHSEFLEDAFFGIMLCGSALTNELQEKSDIDYIVLASKSFNEITDKLAVIRLQLEKELGYPCSNTIVYIEDIGANEAWFMRIDGKAVQAIIESDSANTLLKRSYRLPTLQKSEIKLFAQQNFYVLKALVLKELIRSDNPMTDYQKSKVAKIALIMGKMILQADSPRETMRSLQSLNLKLQKIKINPAGHSDDLVRRTLDRFHVFNP